MWTDADIESVDMSQAELESYRGMFTQMALVDLRWAQTQELWRLRAEQDRARKVAP
jgi:hypothetical protein